MDANTLAEIILDVLENTSNHPDEIEDPIVRDEVLKIKARYSQLKVTNDFTASARQARMEWLMCTLQDNPLS